MMSRNLADQSLVRDATPRDREVFLRVRSRRRVFKLRIWGGMILVKIGFWIMGCRGEASQ